MWLLDGMLHSTLGVSRVPKLTKSVVLAVPIPIKQPTFVWDNRIAGFGLKVLPTGSRKYVYKYRVAGGRSARQRWLALGTHGAITPEQAHTLAQKAAAQVAAGEDPQRERLAVQQQSLTNLWEEFVHTELSKKKPATQRDYRSLWERLIKPKFGSTRVTELTRHEVSKFHTGLAGHPYQANRSLAVLSMLMNLAEEWEWRAQGTNPCKFVKKYPEKGRERFLSETEIANLCDVMELMAEDRKITHSAGNLLLLLLLTGARVSELRDAQWAWVNSERMVIELPEGKTGGREIFISDAAYDVLERQRAARGTSIFIFPGADPEKPLHNLRKPWLRVCATAGLSGVRIHDLRHTAASVALNKGASLALIGRLLGHKQAQTTQRYAHLADDAGHQTANLIGNVVRPQPTAEEGAAE